MVTVYDVARLAGVSTATVSRVVHGHDRVREATRIRVQRAIEELGYVPDGAAQSLSRRRKEVIGLVCKEREVDYALENAGLLYYDQVLRGVEEHIRAHDWSLLMTFMQADEAGEPDVPRLDALSGKVDGILLGEGFVASITSNAWPRASRWWSSPGRPASGRPTWWRPTTSPARPRSSLT